MSGIEWTPEHDAQCDDAIAWHVQRERDRIRAEIAALPWGEDFIRLSDVLRVVGRRPGHASWCAPTTPCCTDPMDTEPG